jgi:hypothetical protein
MVAKPSTTLVAVAVIVAALLAPKGARAIEVKKSLYSNPGPSSGSGPSAPGPTSKENPIPAAQRQQLSDTIASESDSFLSEESEKKSSGKGTYVDLEHAKFMYVPTQKAGKWNVQAKLQAAEYTPSKTGEGKGKPTGKQRVLIFSYRLDGSKWTEVEKPKWEDVADANAPAAAAKK